MKLKYYKDDEVTMSSLIKDECGTENEGYRPDNVMLCYYYDLLYSLTNSINRGDDVAVIHSDNVCNINDIDEFINESEFRRINNFSYMNFRQSYCIFRTQDGVEFAVDYSEGNTGIFIDKKYVEAVEK